MNGNEKTSEVLEQFLRKLPQGEESVLDLVRDLGHDDEGNEVPRITLRLQNRLCQPEDPRPAIRKESPRRAHVFYDAVAFSDYLDRAGTSSAVVLADVGSNRIHAVLDESAKTGFEVVSLAPQIHPLFEPWSAMLGADVPLDLFAKRVLENRSSITFPDSKELTFLLSQVRASKKVDIQSGIGKHSINGIMVELDIKAQGQQTPLDFPDAITIQTPIFVGGQPSALEIDLTLSLSRDDKVLVCPTSSFAKVAVVQAFEQIIEKVRKAGRIVGFGNVAFEDWDALVNLSRDNDD